MHELLKMIKYAKCRDVTFLRLGTSGGLGIPPGSVVITKQGVDGLLRPVYEVPILGKLVSIPAVFPHSLVQELHDMARDEFPDFDTFVGDTMCTQDFYEGQARLDGAFCHYTVDEKMAFLKNLSENGVVNIEMESVTFGAMCHQAGIPAAIICVTLLDRLKGDQIVPGLDYIALQKRPQQVAAKFIKKRLGDIQVSI